MKLHLTEYKELAPPNAIRVPLSGDNQNYHRLMGKFVFESYGAEVDDAVAQLTDYCRKMRGGAVAIYFWVTKEDL